MSRDLREIITGYGGDPEEWMIAERLRHVQAEPDRDPDIVISQAADLIEAQAAEIQRLRHSVQWLRQRIDRLQREQARIPDPWRTLVCDIIANGTLLPDPDGKRYGEPPK